MAIKYIKNILNYIRHGGFKNNGIVYVNVHSVEASNLLSGKNIIITGGTSGIGYAIAKKCVELGAIVMIIGRDKEKLFKTQKELGQAQCNIYQYDISNTENIDNELSNIIKMLGGKVDVFINNAGVMYQHEAMNVDRNEFEKTFDTNIKAPYFLSQYIMNYYIKNKIRGNILMISSNGSLVGQTEPYSMTKAAINHYTIGLAKYGVKYGIRCNAIAPGYTATSITKEFEKVQVNDNMSRDCSKGFRWHNPQEIAEVAAFLISDASLCINGQIIVCDDGESLR